jgi:hypothetical protein
MKNILLTFISLSAACVSRAEMINCDGSSSTPSGYVHIYINTEEQSFNFAQGCWNPCHLGSGKVKVMQTGFDMTRYELSLDSDSSFYIEPINQQKMQLYMESLNGLFLNAEATLTDSDQTSKIILKCHIMPK